MAIQVSDTTVFRDRTEAGRLLGEALKPLALDDPRVLALPRGGVPVAFEVARALGAPLDLMLVRKIGAPGCPELAIGAVAAGPEPQTMLNDDVIATVRPPDGYLEEESWRQLGEMERQRRLYLGDREAAEAPNHTVILVDDGIATGATIKAALLATQRSGAEKVVIAVPVGPPEVVAELRISVSSVVCLVTPPSFLAVGLHYASFEQITDDEVVRLLADARPA